MGAAPSSPQGRTQTLAQHGDSTASFGFANSTQELQNSPTYSAASPTSAQPLFEQQLNSSVPLSEQEDSVDNSTQSQNVRNDRELSQNNPNSQNAAENNNDVASNDGFESKEVSNESDQADDHQHDEEADNESEDQGGGESQADEQASEESLAKGSDEAESEADNASTVEASDDEGDVEDGGQEQDGNEAEDDDEGNDDEDTEDEENTNPPDESNGDHPSDIFIPLEDRTISELQNLDLDEFDFQQPPSKFDTMLWRIGIICVCLVVTWITSFPVLTAFVSAAIPSPEISQVVDRWESTVQATVSQVDTSKECYNTEYDKCHVGLEKGILEFRGSMASAFAALDDGIAVSARLYTPCGDQHSDIVRAFNVHRELGYPISFDTAACTPEEIQSTRDLIGYDDDSYANRIVQHLNEVQEEWAYRFSNITDSVRARHEYDTAYFSAKFAQLKIPIGRLKTIALNITIKFADLSRSVLNLDPEFYIPTFSPYPLEAQISDYVDLFQHLWSDARGIWIEAKAQAHRLGFPNLFPDFDIAFPLDLADFGAVTRSLSGGRDYLRYVAKGKAGELQDIGRDAQNTFNSLLAQLQARVELQLNRIETSFNPPSVHLDMPRLKLDIANDLSAQFDSVSRAIDSMAEQAGVYKTQAKDYAEEVVETMHPTPYLSAKLGLSNLSRYEWPLLIGAGDYQEIFDMFAQINLVFLIFDITYRVTATLQTVFNYGKMTQSTMSTLDLRRNSGDHNRFIDFLSQIPYGLIGPALSILTMLLFFVLMFLYIIFSYVRMYKGYIDGCVNSRNSTFIGESAYTIAYNFANDSSRVVGKVRQQVYTGLEWGTCKNETYDLTEQFRKKTFQLNLDSQSYRTNRNDLTLLNKCIDKTVTYTNINPIDSNGTVHSGRYLWTSSQSIVSSDQATQILTGSAFDIQQQQRQQQLIPKPNLFTSFLDPAQNGIDGFAHARGLSAYLDEDLDLPLEFNCPADPRNCQKDAFDLLNERYPDPSNAFFRGKNSLKAFNNHLSNQSTAFAAMQDNDPDPAPTEIYVSPERVNAALGTECSAFASTQYPWNGFEQRLSTPSECRSYIPTCTIADCSPSVDVITIATHYSSCDSEWMLHSSIMKFFALLVLLISLNVSRIFLVKFMTQYLFHRLGNVDVETVEFYRYRELTTTITPAERRQAIQGAIRSTQSKSTIWLALSLVINVPWMVMIFSLMQTMAPVR